MTQSRAPCLGFLTTALGFSGLCLRLGGSPRPRSGLLSLHYSCGRPRHPRWAPKCLPRGSKRATWPPLSLRWEKLWRQVLLRSGRKRDGKGDSGSMSKWPSAALRALPPACPPAPPSQQTPRAPQRYCQSCLCFLSSPPPSGLLDLELGLDRLCGGTEGLTDTEERTGLCIVNWDRGSNEWGRHKIWVLTTCVLSLVVMISASARVDLALGSSVSTLFSTSMAF